MGEKVSLFSGLLRKLAMTNRVSVILNEVKNRIVTKGNPQQRFFTSFRMTFFSLVIFRLFEAFFGVSQ